MNDAAFNFATMMVQLSILLFLLLPIGNVFAWLHVKRYPFISSSGVRFAWAWWFLDLLAIAAFFFSGIWYCEHCSDQPHTAMSDVYGPALVLLTAILPWGGVAYTLTRQTQRVRRDRRDRK